MSKAIFPTMLTKKATLLSRLTRVDLLVVGVTYMGLSLIKVSGTLSLFIIVLILVLLKFFQKNFNKGFFRFLGSEKLLPWRYRL